MVLDKWNASILHKYSIRVIASLRRLINIAEISIWNQTLQMTNHCSTVAWVRRSNGCKESIRVFITARAHNETNG